MLLPNHMRMWARLEVTHLVEAILRLPMMHVVPLLQKVLSMVGPMRLLGDSIAVPFPLALLMTGAYFLCSIGHFSAFANVVAGLSCKGLDGYSDVPSREEALKFLGAMKVGSNS